MWVGEDGEAGCGKGRELIMESRELESGSSCPKCAFPPIVRDWAGKVGMS